MKRIVSVIIALLVLNQVKATHNRGGDITYKRVAPFTQIVNGVSGAVYNYEITVTKYHNYGAQVVDRCVDTVRFGDGTSGIALRSNGPLCAACDGTTGCGLPVAPVSGPVKISTYTISHTYPGPGNYLIRSLDPNRNFDIQNIPQSGQQPFYLEALLIIGSSFANDHSSVSQAMLVETAWINQCFSHLPQTTDADGDSLSFEITTNRGNGGSALAGYSYLPGYYAINSATGYIDWCSPPKLGTYAAAYIIKEWRKNTNGVSELVGYVLRDLEITVHSGPLAIPEMTEPLYKVWPSPAGEILHVEGAENKPLFFEIIDLTGSVILAGKADKSGIKVEGLQDGIYLLKLQSAAHSKAIKFLKH